MSSTPATLLPLLRELNDLKRIRSTAHMGSIAERLFARAWSGLVGGVAIAEVMAATVAAALTAARLGDLDAEALAGAGLEVAEIREVRARALAEVAAPLDSALATHLASGLDVEWPVIVPPSFVARLAAQPRAGATCPGQPRLLLEPPESHAEHCLMVALYGVLLSPHYGADAETVFLASLAHHLHNALLPDSGFTGEMLLGAALEPAFARATAIALKELATSLRGAVVRARTILPTAESAEGRAFHAADTLDRVLQLDQHLRAGRTTMQYLLHDMALVHAGPVKGFQDALLVDTGFTA